ncbi:hypothetical protein [Flavobacterium phragmitis]|uniref:Lipocalin-like domain-containing protein n=1 Tax=Flavobacterium phragmitis TaxID=739143 RepID=A0A1I1R4J5_9FLAO|nr:hypothetical protein [Flavobacterium phragmitis]SFD25210.1 hypothetical protein SAMN05216297_10644 [Flavobacterium phragmitis]
MRKSLYYFVALLFIVFLNSACSADAGAKDDDLPICPIAIPLEGKWQASQSGTVINGQEVLKPYENKGNCGIPTIEFLPNTNFISTYFDYDDQNCSTNVKKGKWIDSSDDKGVILSLLVDDKVILQAEASIINTTLKLKSQKDGITYIDVFERK